MSGIVRTILLLIALTLFGAGGLWWIEGWSFFDSLYMTVITLSTVGYSEVHPLSTAGRAFIMVYLMLGIGVFLYGIVAIGEVIVRAQISQWLGKRKMDTTLKSLDRHFIVCGYGRMGQTVCSKLAARGLPFVVIERDDELLEQCRDAGWPCVAGDATDDRLLSAAGLERARGLATVLGNDADNLYIVMTARLARADLLILARAGDDKAVKKMEKAGANRVVSLYTTGATKIVQLLSSPNLEDFIEVAVGEGREIDLAEIQVSSRASCAGKTLAQTDLRARGIIVVSIKRETGEVLTPPPSSARIDAGDSLVALGPREAIPKLIKEV